MVAFYTPVNVRYFNSSSRRTNPFVGLNLRSVCALPCNSHHVMLRHYENISYHITYRSFRKDKPDWDKYFRCRNTGVKIWLHFISIPKNILFTFMIQIWKHFEIILRSAISKILNKFVFQNSFYEVLIFVLSVLHLQPLYVSISLNRSPVELFSSTSQFLLS